VSERLLDVVVQHRRRARDLGNHAPAERLDVLDDLALLELACRLAGGGDAPDLEQRRH
jgi:hypothetical protein